MKNYFNFNGILHEDYHKNSVTYSVKDRLLNYLHRSDVDWKDLFETFLKYVPDSVIEDYVTNTYNTDIDDPMFDETVTEAVDDLNSVDVLYKIFDQNNKCIYTCKDVDTALYKARLYDASRVDMCSYDSYSNDESTCVIWDNEDGLI